MIKNLCAQRLKKLILRIKVRKKGTSSNIGTLNNLFGSDFGVVLLFQQRLKRLKHSLPRLLLSSIHADSLPTVLFGNQKATEQCVLYCIVSILLLF